MVDESIFVSNRNRNFKSIRTVIHVGRLDPSKQVAEVVQTFLDVFGYRKDVRLFLIGEPTPGNENYLEGLKKSFRNEIELGQIVFVGALNKRGVMQEMSNADLLMHAYQGSLDKVLVEAVLMELPIVSSNSEFNAIFGSSSNPLGDSTNDSLDSQCKQFIGSSPEDILEIVQKRRALAMAQHSLSSWISNFKREIQHL
jgi:glycosyltransferase involved in cell wall biosynthesis